jgi:nucleoside-diphosphate-sugar epimerase
VPVPAVVPDIPLQFVHEDDVGRALLQCVVAAGPPGAYNIAGDGIVSTVEVAREFGLVPISVSARPAQATARVVARLPFLPSVAEWVEAVAQPAIMDISKAKRELAWEPQYTGLQALRDTLR